MRRDTDGPSRFAAAAVGAPAIALVACWGLSALAFVVGGVWTSVALRLWAPFILGLIWGCPQLALVAVATWRMRRSAHRLRSWWLVAAALPALLLIQANVLGTLLMLGGTGVG